MRNNTTTPTNKFSSPYSLEPSSPSTSFHQTPLQSTYNLETFSSFLLRIGASYHPEGEHLKKLGNLYEFARVLPEKDETIFNAVCCCIFEKLVNMEAQALFESQIRALFGTEEWVRSQIFLFTTLLKGFGQEYSNSRKLAKLYEGLVRDTNLYQKGVSASKEILEKIIKQIEFSGEKFRLMIFFKWMNEFDNLTHQLFKKLAQTLQVNLKFIIMEATTLKEENYNYTQPSFVFNPGSQVADEFVIFYHKVRDQAFLLSHNPDIKKAPLFESVSLNTSPIDIRPSSPFLPSDLMKETPKIESKFIPQNYNFKALPVIKEDVEMRYGTLQNLKPKFSNENQLIEKKIIYSTPTPAPINTDNIGRVIRNPPIHLKIDTENIGNHHQPYSPLGSDWLSRDSFSDLPSQLDGLERSLSNGIAFSNDKLEQAKRQNSSPLHSVALIRSRSDPYNHNITSFTPKPKSALKGDFLDTFCNEVPRSLRVQTPNRLLHKKFDFNSYHTKNREKIFQDNFILKKEIIKEEVPMVNYFK